MARSLGVVLALAAAILLVACGDDGGESTTAADELSGGTEDAAGRHEGADAESGGEPGAESAGPQIDACELLTDDEVAAAVGHPVEPGRAEEPMVIQGSGCTWDADSGDGLRIEISLEVAEPGVYTDIEPEGEEISGVGDLAYWEEELVTLLRVVVGDQYFQIWPTYNYDRLSDPRRDSDAGVRKEVAIELARLAAERI